MAKHGLVDVTNLPPCQLCKELPAAGVYDADFGTMRQVLLLCAGCGLFNAAKRWCGGYMRKDLKRIRLLLVLVPAQPVYRRGELREECSLFQHIQEAE